MRHGHFSIRRRFALIAAAALAAVGAALSLPTMASAATCDSVSGQLCGTDFTALRGIEFSGQVGTLNWSVAGPCDPTLLPGVSIDWGDQTATSAATFVLDNCVQNPFGNTLYGHLNGTHSYTATGTYTVVLALSTGSTTVTATAIATVREQQADLSVAMVAPSSVKNGAALIYMINVANAGPLSLDRAQNVVLTDQLPYGTVFLAVTASGWTCAAPAVGAPGGTVTCTVDSLAVGSSVATSIGVKVKAHANRGVLTNAASVTSTTPDPNASNNTVSATTTVTK